MLTPRGNCHHSKLPRPGEIGYLTMDLAHGGTFQWRKVIVESYPLTDATPWRGCYFGRGVHTAIFRCLDNGERLRVAGYYFVAEDDYEDGRLDAIGRQRWVRQQMGLREAYEAGLRAGHRARILPFQQPAQRGAGRARSGAGREQKRAA